MRQQLAALRVWIMFESRILQISILTAFLALTTQASASTNEQLQMNGELFGEQQFVNLFLQSVMSSKVPQQNANVQIAQRVYSERIKSDSFYSKTYLSDAYPWIYKHVYFDKGMPAAGVINKWATDKIEVSINYPNDLRPFLVKKEKESVANKFEFKDAIERVDQNVVKGFEKKLQEAVSSVNADLEGLDNVPRFEYLEHTKETNQHYAALRVVLYGTGSEIPSLYGNGRYKRNWVNIREHAFIRDKAYLIFRTPDVEDSFLARVPFTPDSQQQVDGYLLPNEKNEIDMVFCFIWAQHPENVLKALIQECLVRSLGVPEASGFAHSGSFASYWNDASKWSNRYDQDKKKSTDAETNVPVHLSESDKNIIHTLYQKNIKSGANAYDVANQILMKE